MKPIRLIESAEPFYFPGNDIGCLAIHGFTASPQEVRWLGEHLHQQGYTVYGPRLAGHGTTMQAMAQTTWHEWYADVLSGYMMLRARCNKVFALGLSMGGALTLLLARHEAVDGVVAMSVPNRLSLGLRRPLVWLYSLAGGILPKHLPHPDHDPFVQAIIDEQHIRGEKPIGRTAYPGRPARSVLQLRALLGHMRQELPQITAPVLFIHSLIDDLAPYQESHHIFDRVGSRDKRMIVLENSDHVITQDRDRETVFNLVAEFVASHR
ncbi:MAG: alpha/beta fold hydrolase [Anaerolineae bacterium]|nr:alpha/beta fold hydrolase [Anaerolineae bacterium]